MTSGAMYEHIYLRPSFLSLLLFRDLPPTLKPQASEEKKKKKVQRGNHISEHKEGFR